MIEKFEKSELEPEENTDRRDTYNEDVRELLQELEVAIGVPLPELSRAPQIDEDKAREWIETEDNPEIKKIKEKLFANIDHISLKELLEAIKYSSDNIEELVGDSTPYAVMFGEKPHSSEHWIYSLMKNKLPPAAVETWFKGDYTVQEKKDMSPWQLRFRDFVAP